MGEVVYISKVHIERKAGPLRVARLPGEAQEVIFSVHGAIARHRRANSRVGLRLPINNTVEWTGAAGRTCPAGQQRDILQQPGTRCHHPGFGPGS